MIYVSVELKNAYAKGIDDPQIIAKCKAVDPFIIQIDGFLMNSSAAEFFFFVHVLCENNFEDER